MDKIICVGKNYVEHARELGDAVPAEPTYFLKPPSALREATGDGTEIRLPARFVPHFELELVLRLAKRDGAWIFSHYTFGVDVTLRELQAQLKKAGLPWEKAKVFANAAIVGVLYPLESLEALLAEKFTLEVNGVTRQIGRGCDMRWSPGQVLADLPNWFPLREGDLLFTGTPAGVGPLADRDHVVVSGARVRYEFVVVRE